MNRKGFIASIVFLIFFILIWFFNRKTEIPGVYQHDQGVVFGTIYHYSYEYSENLNGDIEKLLAKFDSSVSMFNKNSIITKVNNNDTTVVLDKWFTTVFNRSQQISRISNNAFDITVAPLVNAWGFGFKKSDKVTPGMIDSIRQFVGFNKVELKNRKIIKKDPRTMLDMSAIAKGYGSDVVAEFLESKGIRNYMVEIGGEVMAKGKNKQGECWKIGINRPEDNISANPGEIQAIIHLCNGGLATSGNYRNFYYKDGKRFAHTIDPRTGYPVQHSLLSATVIAKDCMTADAYATAFMVLGLEKSMTLANNNPEIEAYFIYAKDEHTYNVEMTKGFDKYLQVEE